MARTFDFGPEGFLERGFVESVDGSGRVRMTELGRQKSKAWIAGCADVSDRLLTVVALADLRGLDLRVQTGSDAGDASSKHTTAEEAHDGDDVAHLGKLLATVLVEQVDPIRRVRRDQGHPERPHLAHMLTMAGGW
jgi:hypothetical protein